MNGHEKTPYRCGEPWGHTGPCRFTLHRCNSYWHDEGHSSHSACSQCGGRYSLCKETSPEPTREFYVSVLPSKRGYKAHYRGKVFTGPTVKDALRKALAL